MTERGNQYLATLRNQIDAYLVDAGGGLGLEDRVLEPLTSALIAALDGSTPSVRAYLVQALDAACRWEKEAARDAAWSEAVEVALEGLLELPGVEAVILQQERGPRPEGGVWRFGPRLCQGRHLWVKGEGELGQEDLRVLERLVLRMSTRGQTWRVERPSTKGRV